MDKEELPRISNTEIGIKALHLDQLVYYVVNDDCSIHFHETVFAKIGREYFVVYNTTARELAIYLADEGLWICSVYLDTMTYECHTSYHMLASFVVIFGEIRIIE